MFWSKTKSEKVPDTLAALQEASVAAGLKYALNQINAADCRADVLRGRPSRFIYEEFGFDRCRILRSIVDEENKNKNESAPAQMRFKGDFASYCTVSHEWALKPKEPANKSSWPWGRP